MFKLPVTYPSGFRGYIEEAFQQEGPKAWNALLASFIGYFDAQSAILSVGWELSGSPTFNLVNTSLGDQEARDELKDLWFDSSLSQDILNHVKDRVNPISYSMFSWPFKSISSELDKGLSIPANYSIVFPVSNKLCLHLNTRPNFSGFMVITMDNFPEFENEIIQVITILPGLLSSMISESGVIKF